MVVSDLWVRVYNYNTGIELECLKEHHGPIRCLRFMQLVQKMVQYKKKSK